MNAFSHSSGTDVSGEPPAGSEPAGGSPETILIVDDDAALSAATARILTSAGYSVIQAATGAEGLRLAAETRPAFVLLDVMLPDINGIEVCRRIKRDPQLAGSYVILLSAARISPDDRSEGLEGGADDYIVRPVSNRELLARVQAMLRIRETEQQLRVENMRYRRLFEEAPVLQVITRNQDGEPIVEECNRLWLLVLGYTRDDVIGHPLAAFYAPDSRRALLQEGGYQRALDGVFAPEERQLLTRDGTIIHTLLTAVPETGADGQVYGTRAMYLDITARKEAESALRESEQMLQTVLETMPVGVSILDGNGVIQHVNPAGRQIWAGAHYVGIDQFGEYKAWWADTGQPVAPHEWAGARAVERGETSVSEMIDIESFDGTRKTILNSAVPLRDTEGRISGAVAVIQDITPLRAAEAELRRRNRELALLNRIISASVGDATPESLLETACRELAQAFGAPLVTALLAEEKTPGDFRTVAESRTPDQPSALGSLVSLVGHPILQEMLSSTATIRSDDVRADPRLEMFGEAIEIHRVRSLMLLPLVVGEHLAGFLNVVAREPGRFTEADAGLAQGVARQIEASLARVRLEQTHRRLITAIEQAADCVIITDADANVVYVNPIFEALTGYHRDEVIGRNPRLLKSGQQDAGFYRQMWAALSAGEVWRGRLINRRKDGSLFTEEATISPVRNQDGVIVSFVGVKHDITQELALEEQFLRAQRMEAVGRLTAGIAHDFNNLLTAINGFAELLRLALPPDHPAYDMAGKIHSAGQRAADLVSQLLAYSRKQMIQPQVLDLNEVVSSVDRMLQRIIGEDVHLVAVPGAGLWPVTIDRTQIEQVIVNLAVNARDAMPNGGRLSIETTNVTLEADYGARHLGVTPGDYVLLAVSDTGAGMSTDVQSHLFEPFFTTKGVGKGTGLGLAAVYGIVKQNGGNIWVYSEVGHGSTFKVYLPRAAQPAGQDAGPAALADIPVGTETILLAEDSEVVRDLALNVLRRQGYRVLAAPDGARALQAAEDYNGPIHLLITDVVMPGMSGRVLADRLLAVRPETKVLFMSGYTEDAIAHHSVLTPGTALMEKPFSPPALARRVRRILDGDV